MSDSSNPDKPKPRPRLREPGPEQIKMLRDGVKECGQDLDSYTDDQIIEFIRNWQPTDSVLKGLVAQFTGGEMPNVKEEFYRAFIKDLADYFELRG